MSLGSLIQGAIGNPFGSLVSGTALELLMMFLEVTEVKMVYCKTSTLRGCYTTTYRWSK